MFSLTIRIFHSQSKFFHSQLNLFSLTIKILHSQSKSGTHFWITLQCSSFEKKLAYLLSITAYTTFSPISLVYFFSCCSRIMTYCFLLCLSKRYCGASVQVDSCHNGNLMSLQIVNSL